MKTSQTNRRLQPGTTVISTLDGERGTVLNVCTYRRNGIDAWSYLIETDAGREIWHSGDLMVLNNEQN